MKATVYGVGINDADYPVQPTVSGKKVICQFYQKWQSMMQRCYSEKYKQGKPTYAGCTVCAEWLKFSNFRAWMEAQDWKGKHLDKDLLVSGNKVYSPETCVFVTQQVNSFMNDHASVRGEFPTGVCWHIGKKKYESHCSNPFTKKYEHLGVYDCPNEAHLAWRRRKNEFACALADLQPDNRVAEALRVRYNQ